MPIAAKQQWLYNTDDMYLVITAEQHTPTAAPEGLPSLLQELH